MIGRNAKRLLLVVGLALLLPGAAGAAGFGPAEPSFWSWSGAAALFDRLWEGWGELTGVATNGGSIDPNGGGTTENGGSIDPHGGGTTENGGSIDPHG